MRNRYQRRRYCRRERSHSVGAWILLILSWIAVLPVAAFVLHSIHTELQPAETPNIDPVQSTFAQTYMKTAELQIEYFAPALTLRSDAPSVLIYHTHTTEAYFPSKDTPYRETSSWRTDDNSKNVVAVGEALKEILETQYGFCVLHDMTDHEPPKLATAYERSLLTMQRYHEQYPSIVLFIDLHRDAYENPTKPADYLTINGTETARMMFVVGKGEKYEDKPYFDTNYALADRITKYLMSIDEKLARPIRVKPGRYNQHVAPNCLLVEVGHNANTIEQALAAMPYLAEGIAYSFGSNRASLDWSTN